MQTCRQQIERMGFDLSHYILEDLDEQTVLVRHDGTGYNNCQMCEATKDGVLRDLAVKLRRRGFTCETNQDLGEEWLSHFTVSTRPKPCPCCGSQDLYIGIMTAFREGIACERCGLRMEQQIPNVWPVGVSSDEELHEWQLRQAVGRWNKRTAIATSSKT